MNLILFDDPLIQLNLLPFTFTRPTSKIRVGILTIAEKWENWLNTKAYYKTEGYLQQKFAIHSTDQNLLINGAVCPDQKLVDAVRALPAGYFLVKGTLLIAACKPESSMNDTNTVEYAGEVIVINKPWKIFVENARQMKIDFDRITYGRRSAGIQDKHTKVYGEENIFVEEGVTIKAAIINAETGPVYLGKNSIVQEGAIIRGSLALCEGAHLNMGAKMRGDTTVGPYSKVGGEVSAMNELRDIKKMRQTNGSMDYYKKWIIDPLLKAIEHVKAVDPPANALIGYGDRISLAEALVVAADVPDEFQKMFAKK